MKAIMFDLDGTLIDSMPVWKSMDKLYIEHKGFKYDRGVTERLKAVSVADTSKVLDEIYGTEGAFLDVWDFVYGRMKEHYREVFDFKPYVLDKLKSLKDKGIKMCITTASSWGLIEDFVERKKLLDYMDFILTPDLAGFEKDSRQFFDLALKRLGSKKENTYLVDDAYYALKRASDMGLVPVGVHDIQEAEELEEVKKIARLYLRDFRDLSI